MSTVELTPNGSDSSVEVEFKEIANALGDEYILNQDVDKRQFAYLAAIALETHDDEYAIQETLMEFIRNTGALDSLDADDCDKIETILK